MRTLSFSFLHHRFHYLRHYHPRPFYKQRIPRALHLLEWTLALLVLIVAVEARWMQAQQIQLVSFDLRTLYRIYELDLYRREIPAMNCEGIDTHG